MADEASDPKIVDRLSKLPPFDEETPPAVAPQTLEETPEEPETPQEEPETPVEEVKEEETPQEEEKDRTKEQFEKLKAHNAELKKKLEEQETPKKNALDSLYPEPPQYPESPITNVVPTPQQYPNLTQKEIKDVFAGLVDSQGYVDSGLLIQTMKENDQKAKKAEEELLATREELKKVGRKQDDFERKQIMKEVHAFYPKLDPENANSDDPEKKFDQRVYDQFRKETMFQWTTTGVADPIKVAELAYGTIYGVRKADKEKAVAAETAKKNINATTVRPASTASNYTDRDELVRATRKGEHSAIMERLNRIGQ